MTGREHESYRIQLSDAESEGRPTAQLTISVEPLGVGRVVSHLVTPEGETDCSSAHDGTRVASLVLLTQVGGETPNSVQDKLFFFGLSKRKSEPRSSIIGREYLQKRPCL